MDGEEWADDGWERGADRAALPDAPAGDEVDDSVDLTPQDPDRLGPEGIVVEACEVDDVIPCMAAKIHGTCASMCPAKEHREKTFVVNFESSDTDPKTPNPARRVKRYWRSDAGSTNNEDPSFIRTPRALYESTVYLLTTVLTQEGVYKHWSVGNRKPRTIRYIDIFGYVMDRLRSVRNDFKIQSHTSLLTIRCLEYTVRFHIMSGHLLCKYSESETGGFDPKRNRDMLGDSLIDNLWACYDAFRDKYKDHATGLPVPNVPALRHQGEFAAYRLLFRELRQHDDHKKWRESTCQARDSQPWLNQGLGYRSTDDEVKSLLQHKPDLLDDPYVRSALKIIGLYTSDNWPGYFAEVRNVPYLQACLMATVFPFARVMYISQLVSGYAMSRQGKRQRFSVDFFRKRLMFDDNDTTRSFMHAIGFRTHPHDPDSSLSWEEAEAEDDFKRYGVPDCSQTKACDMRYPSLVVESRRKHRSHLAVCIGHDEGWPEGGAGDRVVPQAPLPVVDIPAPPPPVTPLPTCAADIADMPTPLPDTPLGSESPGPSGPEPSPAAMEEDAVVSTPQPTYAERARKAVTPPSKPAVAVDFSAAPLAEPKKVFTKADVDAKAAGSSADKFASWLSKPATTTAFSAKGDGEVSSAFAAKTPAAAAGGVSDPFAKGFGTLDAAPKVDGGVGASPFSRPPAAGVEAATTPAGEAANPFAVGFTGKATLPKKPSFFDAKPAVAEEAKPSNPFAQSFGGSSTTDAAKEPAASRTPPVETLSPPAPVFTAKSATPLATPVSLAKSTPRTAPVPAVEPTGGFTLGGGFALDAVAKDASEAREASEVVEESADTAAVGGVTPELAADGAPPASSAFGRVERTGTLLLGPVERESIDGEPVKEAPQVVEAPRMVEPPRPRTPTLPVEVAGCIAGEEEVARRDVAELWRAGHDALHAEHSSALERLPLIIRVNRFHERDGMRALLLSAAGSRVVPPHEFQALQAAPAQARALDARSLDGTAAHLPRCMANLRTIGDASPWIAAACAQQQSGRRARRHVRVLVCGETAGLNERLAMDEVWGFLGGSLGDAYTSMAYADDDRAGRLTLQLHRTHGFPQHTLSCFADVAVLTITGLPAAAAAAVVVDAVARIVVTQAAHGAARLSGVVLYHFSTTELVAGEELQMVCDMALSQAGLDFVKLVAVGLAEPYDKGDVVDTWQAVIGAPCQGGGGVPLHTLLCDAAAAVQTYQGTTDGEGLVAGYVASDASMELNLMHHVQTLCNKVLVAVADALAAAGVAMAEEADFADIADHAWCTGDIPTAPPLPQRRTGARVIIEDVLLQGDAGTADTRRNEQDATPHHALAAAAAKVFGAATGDVIGRMLKAAATKAHAPMQQSVKMLLAGMVAAVLSACRGDALLAVPMFLLPTLRERIGRAVHAALVVSFRPGQPLLLSGPGPSVYDPFAAVLPSVLDVPMLAFQDVPAGARTWGKRRRAGSTDDGLVDDIDDLDEPHAKRAHVVDTPLSVAYPRQPGFAPAEDVSATPVAQRVRMEVESIIRESASRVSDTPRGRLSVEFEAHLRSLHDSLVDGATPVKTAATPVGSTRGLAPALWAPPDADVEVDCERALLRCSGALADAGEWDVLADAATMSAADYEAHLLEYMAAHR